MHSLLCNSPATHPALHLRDAADAHIVFEAVRLDIIPIIKRRLTAEERDQVASGHVFVWEEAEHKGGLERWTDGRRWSQSRMKGDYLFYEEKVDTTQEEKEAKAARRANRVSDSRSQSVIPSRRQDRPTKPDGLTKQTYSTHVFPPGASAPRKWHIVAYFSGNDYTRLPVVENYEYLRNIRVPDGIFFSSKGMIKNFHADFQESNYNTPSHGIKESPAPRSQVTSPRSPRYEDDREQYPRSPSYALPAPAPRHAYYHEAQLIPEHVRPQAHRTTSHPSVSLPRLSTITPLQPHAFLTPSPVTAARHGHSLRPPHPLNRSTSLVYKPLSPEDRRALDTFRVVL